VSRKKARAFGAMDGGLGLTVRTNENVCRVDQLVLSQDVQPGTHRTVRHTARETEMPRSTVFDVIHKDLKVTLYWKPRYFVINIRKLITLLSNNIFVRTEFCGSFTDILCSDSTAYNNLLRSVEI